MPANEIERPSGDVGLRLTYAEIAARLGISGDAARQLVRRRGWFRIVPNRRGAPTTVIVPEGELMGERRDTRPPVEGGMTPDGDRGELRLALSTVDRLSVQLTEARARADAERVRADRAEARADQERLAADRFRAESAVAQEAAEARLSKVEEAHGSEVAGLRVRADEAVARAERAEGERDVTREAHAKAMQANRKWEAADAARKARGRLRRAWDGWRGR